MRVEGAGWTEAEQRIFFALCLKSYRRAFGVPPSRKVRRAYERLARGEVHGIEWVL